MLLRSLTLLTLVCSSPALLASDDLAYSLGATLGERLRTELPHLPINALLNGLRDAYQNEPLRLSKDQIETLLERHQEQLLASKIDPAEAAFLQQEQQRPGVRRLQAGVLAHELRAGNGEPAKAGSWVKVSYRGELADGRLFDQTDEPQWFALDALIPGWQIALQQMSVGSRWRLVIPSAQAYGEEGSGDLIPANAPLVFDLDLLAIRTLQP